MVDITADTIQANTDAFKKILSGLMNSPTLMEVYKEQFIIPRREALKQIIEKGIKRGEINDNINIDHLIDIIGGSYFYSIIINDEPITTEVWVERIKPIILNGIAPEKRKN